jgi:peroxiredoxin Q/BCP
MAVQVGDPFPSVPVRQASGALATVPQLLAGRPAVVYFYPKDNTPGCTREAHDFQRLLPEFEAAGVRVFGVSVDDQASHATFAQGCGLTFPLLSDEGGALARALGILHPERGYAKRTTYLVGADGRIRHIWEDVRVEGHAEEVLARARAL